MARDINEGESLYIPFRNGRSINDTQNRARMYRTPEAFQRHFPGYEFHANEVVLLEYAPVVHGRWKPNIINNYGIKHKNGFNATCCGGWNYMPTKYCPNCGASMRDGDGNG